jgi:hypothetical protein
MEEAQSWMSKNTNQAQKEQADFRALCAELVHIDNALDGGKASISNQGQALDGYSALAAFRDVADRARAALAKAKGEETAPLNEENLITPPDELVNKWHDIWLHAKVKHVDVIRFIATQAAHWGWEQRGAVNETELQKARDDELAACCTEISFYVNKKTADKLRALRRPPSKTEIRNRAIEAVNDWKELMDNLNENTKRTTGLEWCAKGKTSAELTEIICSALNLIKDEKE